MTEVLSYKKYLVEYYERYIAPNPIFTSYYSPLKWEDQIILSKMICGEEKLFEYSSGLDIVSELHRNAFYVHMKHISNDPYVSSEFKLTNSLFIEEGLKRKVFKIGGVTYLKDVLGFKVSKKTSYPDSTRKNLTGTASQIEFYGLGTTKLFDVWKTNIQEDEYPLEYLTVEEKS